MPSQVLPCRKIQKAKRSPTPKNIPAAAQPFWEKESGHPKGEREGEKTDREGTRERKGEREDKDTKGELADAMRVGKGSGTHKRKAPGSEVERGAGTAHTSAKG